MEREALERQIEAAFNYRGHVTVRLKAGGLVEGFLFNRQFKDARLAQDEFVELFVKGTGERLKLAVGALDSVELTGADCAAGNSYEDYLKKRAAKAGPTGGTDHA
jgi:hypothetical protein